ncbi:MULTISPECIES: glycosyltransferase 87 family protein [Nocardioides]|uniref:glycosyltransferase 87 family protein n=1 Tax=Nocardioides TaxID=1839 RepID=UPI00032DCEC0|nr:MULTISPECIES: glycosyltransferase 87 family protein [Nocardioides]EON22354.1 integral membrane protein [Nocardioides sp. CF8]
MSDPARDRVSPSREDALVRSVSEAVGGPLGDHAGQHPWWTPLRVVLLLAAVALSLGIVAKAPCLDIAGEAGNTGRYTNLCWSDISTAYVANGLAEGTWPFTDDAQARARYAPAWQPPLPAYVAFASQRVTALLSGSPDLEARALVPVPEVAEQPGVLREARIFTLVNIVLLAGVGLLAAGLLTGVRRHRPWDAAAFALAPVLVLFFPIGWDLLAAAGVTAALWGWSRRRLGVTGVAIGVAAAASPFAALLLVPGIALLARDRRWPEAGILGAGAVAAWTALMLPAVASSPSAWLTSWKAYFHGADIGSAWLLASQVTGLDPSLRMILGGTAVLLLVVCVVVVVLAWRTQWSFASLGTLLVAEALIVSPAAAPSFALVLLPLAVVAVRQWSHLLVWQACEIGHWAMLGFYLGGILAPSGGGDARAYWLGVVLRLAGLVWLIGVTAMAAAEREPEGPGSADVDAVEGRGREADPDLDVLTDVGHPRT